MGLGEGRGQGGGGGEAGTGGGGGGAEEDGGGGCIILIRPKEVYEVCTTKTQSQLSSILSTRCVTNSHTPLPLCIVL